jgi:hypothetical protein
LLIYYQRVPAYFKEGIRKVAAQVLGARGVDVRRTAVIYVCGVCYKKPEDQPSDGGIGVFFSDGNPL